MRNQVTLEEVLDVAAFQLRAKMYKTMPGIVTVGGSRTVTVQPAVHDVRFDVDTGERFSEPWPVIPDVPVAWPKFGGFSIVGTMATGDKVLLLAYDLDPTRHMGTGNAEDPVDTARHAGGYWIAYPTDITDAGALPDPGGDCYVGVPAGGKLRLGGASATDAAALASIMDSFIKVFLQTWTPVPKDGGLALKTALVAWALTAMPPGVPFSTSASSVVKVSP